jgi:hypothetical protein
MSCRKPSRDALGRDHSRRLGSLRQQSQPLFVIQGFPRDQFLGKHIHFSRVGGKVVATAEDCLPPSGAKPDEVTHTTLVGKQYPLSLVTTRSKPSPFRLGFVYFFMNFIISEIRADRSVVLTSRNSIQPRIDGPTATPSIIREMTHRLLHGDCDTTHEGAECTGNSWTNRVLSSECD